MKLFTIIFILLSINCFSLEVMYDRIFDDSIKTIIFSKGSEYNSPAINFETNESMLVKFDRLGETEKQLQYTIIHCDRNWRVSNLLQSEYVDMMGSIDIFDVATSLNTQVKYNHYTFSIPNRELKIKISGNFILKVFSDGDEDNIVFQRRFIVYEDLLTIDMQAQRATVVKYMDECHEIKFTINTNNTFRATVDELYPFLMQNFRWDNLVTNIKPLFIKSNQFIYELSNDNVFEAGNEYRKINFKSFTYLTEEISKYEYEKGMWNVYVKPSIVRKYKQYEYERDLNGRFLVATDNIMKPDIEAEYSLVHFYLPYKVLDLSGDVFVYGGLTNWTIGDENRMKVNYDKMQYELTLLLKQGYYDYQYAFVKYNDNKINLSINEGNFYRTENEYSLFVYYTERLGGYDRIVGYKNVNTAQ